MLVPIMSILVLASSLLAIGILFSLRHLYSFTTAEEAVKMLRELPENPRAEPWRYFLLINHNCTVIKNAVGLGAGLETRVTRELISERVRQIRFCAVMLLAREWVRVCPVERLQAEYEELLGMFDYLRALEVSSG